MPAMENIMAIEIKNTQKKKTNRHKLKNVNGRMFYLALKDILDGKVVYETYRGYIVDFGERYDSD